MNAKMQAAWRKMVGAALLWASLAALVYVPSLSGGERAVIVSVVGFICFCAGLTLFAEGVTLGVANRLRSNRCGSDEP